MAVGRQKGGARREPAMDADPGPRSKATERGPKRRKRGGGGGGGGASRSAVRRLFYWSLVLGLWAMILVAGALALVAATLPPIQSLEIPKRPPSIEIVGIDGKPL